MENMKYYSLDEVAELIQVTRRTVYNYIAGGKLHAVKIGKYWRVSQENLQEFLQGDKQS